MFWTTSFIVFGCTFNLVLSEGYPKEAPSTSFNSGSGHSSGTQSNQIPGSSGGGYGGAVSTDYESRYNGPVAMVMVLPDGTLADTPEVAKAKMIHLAALEKAKALWAAQKGKNGHNGGGSGGYGAGGSDHMGGGAQSFGGYDSNAQDGHSSAGSGSSSGADSNKPYKGPLAMLMVLPDGTLAYTPEVAAARMAHLSALEKAKALWPGKNGGNGGSSQTFGGYDANAQDGHSSGSSGHSSGPSSPSAPISWPGSGAAGNNKPYQGPLAMLMVLPSGFLADTPDINAARMIHLNALMKAQQEAAKWKPAPADWKL